MSIFACCQIKTMFSGVLVALLESLPLGILQILYSQRIASKMGMLDMLSLVTSWCEFCFACDCSGHTKVALQRKQRSRMTWPIREIGPLWNLKDHHQPTLNNDTMAQNQDEVN